MTAKSADKPSAQSAADTVHATAEDYISRYPASSADPSGSGSTAAPSTGEPSAGPSTTDDSGITDTGGGNGY